MYIKIIGSIVLILSAAAVGYLKAEELKVRVRVLKEMKRMITFLQGELRFHRAELSEAFESVSERVDPLFGAFLRQTAEELENNLGTIAKSGSFDFKKDDKLKEEDINIIVIIVFVSEL